MYFGQVHCHWKSIKFYYFPPLHMLKKGLKNVLYRGPVDNEMGEENS